MHNTTITCGVGGMWVGILAAPSSYEQNED